MENLDKILKAISSSTRIRILRFLCEGESCVTLTNKEINISQPNLSQHLKILKEASLIDSKKKVNKRCYYIINLEEVKSLLKSLDNLG